MSNWRAGEGEGKDALRPDDVNSSNEVASVVAASNSASTTTREGTVHPAVLSIGYNPFYNNTVRSVEVHLLSKFERDFYGAELRLMILGFIRTEQDYDSMQALIDDISTDCEVGKLSLERDAWKRYSEDKWLTEFGSRPHAEGPGEGG